MFKSLQTIQYPTFKLVILALLSLNVFLYAFSDTLTSTVDALAWLVLLIMYELEANTAWQTWSQQQMRTIRNGLIVVISLTFLSYVNSSEWLDTINSILWFALIALLELEIRKPELFVSRQRSFWLSTILVFTGLIAMVFAWLWQAAWLDAYDAVLWIAAFAFIEVDIFQFLKLKKP